MSQYLKTAHKFVQIDGVVEVTVFIDPDQQGLVCLLVPPGGGRVSVRFSLRNFYLTTTQTQQVSTPTGNIQYLIYNQFNKCLVF